jgi:hypothetical protein
MAGNSKNALNYHSIKSGDMSSNILSVGTNIQYLDNVSVQFNFTGTPSGYFNVYESNDNINYIQVDLGKTPLASGVAGIILIEMPGLCASWLKLEYVANSGVGTLDAFITAKAI